MKPRPSRYKEAIVLAAVTLRSSTRSFCHHPTNAPALDGKSRAVTRGITLAVAVLVFMLPQSTALAAVHAPTRSTGPGIGTRAGLSTDHNVTDVARAAARQRRVAMHNELLGTNPPDHAQLATGPAQVLLTFDLPAQRGFSTIIVTGPDRHQWQAGPATEQDTTVMAPVRPLGPAGNYTVAWRIISADGHPVRGTFEFTLTTPGTGTPATSSSNTDRATPTSDPRSIGMPVWPWLAGAGALLVTAAVVLGLRASRTRRS